MYQDDILTLHLRQRQLRTLEDMLEQLFEDYSFMARFNLNDYQKEELEVVLASVQLLLDGHSRYSTLNF
jgi:hypothetical protein